MDIAPAPVSKLEADRNALALLAMRQHFHLAAPALAAAEAAANVRQVSAEVTLPAVPVQVHAP